MKLLKVLALSGILLTANIFAAPPITISGNTYCDLDGSGDQNDGEHCSNEAVWVKLRYLDDPNVSLMAKKPDQPSGEFSFKVNLTGNFELFVDDNGDIDDDTPTPPISTAFSAPDTGRTSFTVANVDMTGYKFGLKAADVCDCNSSDGTITEANISIDGRMGDWTNVFLDADNTQCDSAGDSDFDYIKNGGIQSTGRNLVRFSRTVPAIYDGFAYGSTARVGSVHNTEVYLFYRGGYDGYMHSTTHTGGLNGKGNGNIVLAAHWHGQNTIVDMEVCDYIADDPEHGDPMFWQAGDTLPDGTDIPLSWIGKSDGYTIKGNIDCRSDDDIKANGNVEGTMMEYRVPLYLLQLDPNLGFPVYHVSTTNTAPNSTHPPAGIDDNMGPCPLAAPQISLDVNKTVDNDNPYVGENITYTITVTNSGDATSSVEANDTLPTGVTYGGFSGTDWSCTNTLGEQLVQCSYAGVLGGGSSSSVAIIASVDAGTQGTLLTNGVCVNSDENTTLVCDYEDITVASNILQVSKGVSDDEPYVNSIVAYEINVTNTGPNIAYNVVLHDALPTDIDYIDYTGVNWDCTETLTDVIDCNYTLPLGVGETTTVTFGANVNGSVGTLYTNTACAHSDDNTTDVCGSVDLRPKATPTDVVLQTIKVAGNKTPLIGETITYTIAVTNVGTTQATNVEVNDTIPTELTYTGMHSVTAGAFDGTTWSGFNLAPLGGFEILTITATVNGTASVGTSVNNEACAVADENTTKQCGNDDFTPRAPNVTMLIEKSVDNELPKVGSQVIYTIGVTNGGTDTAHDVNVTDALPLLGVTPQGNSASQGTYINDVWNVGTLAPGASAELNITVMIDPDTEGNLISNNACVVADENTTEVCDDANLTVGHVILNTTKSANNINPAEGDPITYTITVINLGDVNATNVKVTDDPLPDQVTFVSAGGNGWTCSGTTTINCDYAGELAPLVPTSFDINVTVNPGTAGQEVYNLACAEADENDTKVCGDSNITVNDDLDLGITKIVDNTTPSEGDTITYTLEVTNYGDINATNIRVNEDLIAISGLSIVSVTPYRTDGSDGTGDSFNGNYTWTISNLASGNSAKLEVVATVIDGAEGEIFINNGVIVDLDQRDTDWSNNHATATITITCPCNDVKSDSSSTFGTVSAALMMLMTLMAGLFFVRREAQLNRYER